MNVADYAATANLLLYPLGLAAFYAIKIIFARMKEGRDQSISDDKGLQGKIDKLTDKTDANEIIRREVDRDLYKIAAESQVKIAYMEGFKDGEAKGKNT